MPTEPTVLVIDDDAETRRLMRRVLEEAAFEVVTEPSAERGLAYLAGHAVACVLIDYRLLDMDGLSCLREIRGAHPTLPAIMVTGAGSQEVAVEAMKLGANDYVVKHRAYLRTVPGIVRAEIGFVWRVLRRLGLSEADADDATQQVFVVAARRKEELQPGKERSFLYGAAQRVAANRRRSQRRSREVPEAEAPAPGDSEALAIEGVASQPPIARKSVGPVQDGRSEPQRHWPPRLPEGSVAAAPASGVPVAFERR